MTYLIRLLLVLAALAGFAAAHAQQSAPPEVPLWRVEANGDAVQTDLGFILPARWRDFERQGFTSTRPDGASVMTYYERADGPVRLRILLQLRVDIRGVPLPGADGIERNWPFMKLAAAAEYLSRGQGEAQELADERIVWGAGERSNARMRLVRQPLAEGAEIQGLWYRNIGIWAVVVIVSAPEARRADVEATGRAVMTEMAWPRAPLNADLRAIAPDFLRNVQACEDLDRTGSGQAVEVDAVVASMLGIVLATHFLDHNPMPMPHPVLEPAAYCRIETFRAGEREMVALAWRGDRSRVWTARYAFMMPLSGTFFQIESSLSEPRATAAFGITRLVQLVGSNDRSVSVLQAFTDWPSYEEAKAAVIRASTEGMTPVVQASQPPGQVSILVGRVVPTPPASAQ